MKKSLAVSGKLALVVLALLLLSTGAFAAGKLTKIADNVLDHAFGNSEFVKLGAVVIAQESDKKEMEKNAAELTHFLPPLSK